MIVGFEDHIRGVEVLAARASSGVFWCIVHWAGACSLLVADRVWVESCLDTWAHPVHVSPRLQVCIKNWDGVGAIPMSVYCVYLHAFLCVCHLWLCKCLCLCVHGYMWPFSVHLVISHVVHLAALNLIAVLNSVWVAATFESEHKQTTS